MRTKEHLLAQIMLVDDLEVHAAKCAIGAVNANTMLEEGGEEFARQAGAKCPEEPSNVSRAKVLPTQSEHSCNSAQSCNRVPTSSKLPHQHLLRCYEAARFKMGLHSLGEGSHNESQNVVGQEHHDDKLRTSQQPPHLQQVSQALRAVTSLLPGNTSVQPLVHQVVIVQHRPRHASQIHNLSRAAWRFDWTRFCAGICRQRFQNMRSF
jgi:hypothetical protein